MYRSFWLKRELLMGVGVVSAIEINPQDNYNHSMVMLSYSTRILLLEKEEEDASEYQRCPGGLDETRD